MLPDPISDFTQWFPATFEKRLAARYSTFYRALLLALEQKVKTIVETGTARNPGNWAGDGQSTYVFGAFAQRYQCNLWTCDRNKHKPAKLP